MSTTERENGTQRDVIKLNSPAAKGDIAGFSVGLRALRLVELMYERGSQPLEADSELEMRLSLDRLTLDEVQCFLTTQLLGEKGPSLTVQYSIILKLLPSEQSAANFDFDLHLREAAVRISPVALYPYVRETVTSLMQKAGLTPFTLPVLNMGTVFNPEHIRLASFAE